MLRQPLFWLLLFVPSLASRESDWKWIAGDVKPSGWATVQGPAAVNIKGARLNIEFYATDGGKLEQTLTGSIASGKVEVVRRVLGRDVGTRR
jgi:hypothetical protein